MNHWLKNFLRPGVALLLALLTTVLVSCSGGAPTVKAFTYTPEQIAQIQRYGQEVQQLRDRLIELPPLVQQEQWNDVKSLIHGPLGELRITMSRLARTLQPDRQAEALKAAQEVFEHLIAIDEAAQAQDRIKALRNYNEALKDLEQFFQLVPQGLT